MGEVNVNTTGTTTRVNKKSEIEYTDVVVIGNGPSGICLSYMLSGNWPYYTGEVHSNEYLQTRLQQEKDCSLVLQDLDYLSSGLEGRSSNPVGLLFDALTHPDADMGMETPSLLRWEHENDRHIPHVVLGREGVGGAWQMMEGAMQTLSLGNWMQLPDLPFREWLEKYRSEDAVTESAGDVSPQRHKNRASIKDVRTYYEQYVGMKNLEQQFRTNTTVTSVERVLDVCHSIDLESGEQMPCTRDHCGKVKWEVRGYETRQDNDVTVTMHDFCYRAPNVVLASGTYDLPNRLSVPGDHFPYVMHSFTDFERLLKEGEVTSESDPVMVIGAGLTAADAILLAQDNNIPVVHLFRRDVEDPNIIFKKLPKMLYPEYHAVMQMMRAGSCEHNYTPYSMHNVVELMQDGKVLVRGKDNSGDTIIQTSFVLVLIGSRPDLSFLPYEGRQLGVVPGERIDCKHNPVDVDPITYQSTHECGLFAMGPLAGDNFVRFLRGGALGITSHIWRKRHQKCM